MDRDAAACFARAERLANRAARIGAVDPEGAIHAAYYAMFHAARGALVAFEGGASTSHGRIPGAFAGMVARITPQQGLGHARVLRRAYSLRVSADYEAGEEDLSEDARRLLTRLDGFLAFCRDLAARADGGHGRSP